MAQHLKPIGRSQARSEARSKHAPPVVRLVHPIPARRCEHERVAPRVPLSQPVCLQLTRELRHDGTAPALRSLFASCSPTALILRRPHARDRSQIGRVIYVGPKLLQHGERVQTVDLTTLV